MVLAILALIMQVSLFVFTENFLFCFFPNVKIPWAKPTARVEIKKLLINIAYAVLFSFAFKGGVTETVLFSIVTMFQLLDTIFQFFSIPHYNFYVDKAVLICSSFLSYIYLIGVIRLFLKINEPKISFIVTISVNFLFLLLFIYRIRVTIIRRRFLEPHKGIIDFQIQLVQLARLVIEDKGQMIDVMQNWVTVHKMYCEKYHCEC